MNTEPSFEQVVTAYTSTVYGVALTHTARRADADDVFQEVFFAYWRQKPEITSEEHLKAWLIRTTLNHCLKTTQSSWARRTVYSDGTEYVAEGLLSQAWNSNPEATEERGGTSVLPPLSELPSADFTFQTEQQQALYDALCALPAAYRLVAQLFYFEDLSIAQIAATLGEKQGTVKTRLSRARAQLREMLTRGVYHV